MKADNLNRRIRLGTRTTANPDFDLDIGTAARSGASDSIDDTIHYGEVCDAVRQSLSNQTFLLLEALAEYVAGVVDTGLRRVVGTGAGGEARYSAQCTRSRRGN